MICDDAEHNTAHHLNLLKSFGVWNKLNINYVISQCFAFRYCATHGCPCITNNRMPTVTPPPLFRLLTLLRHRLSDYFSYSATVYPITSVTPPPLVRFWRHAILKTTELTICIFSSAASTGERGDGKGDGKGNGERHINIKTKEDCEAFDGECNRPKDCNLTQSVHMEPASGGTCGGDELDFCCIAKEFMCVHHANGTFIPDAECHAKPGFTASGLELNGTQLLQARRRRGWCERYCGFPVV